MKYIYLICFVIFVRFVSYAQLADITYSVKTINITSYEADCWETGNEQYTGYLSSWDNVNPTATSTGCQTCDFNGNCTYASNISLQSRTSALVTLFFAIDAWEDDQCNRCDYNTSCCSSWCISNSDDCRRNENNSLKIRETGLPSINTTWTTTPTWGGTNNHQYSFNYTWKYSDATVDITPMPTVTTTAYTSGEIRSWVVALTADRLYTFNTTGAEATRITIYGTDGYTVITQIDNPSGAATLQYKPCTSDNYYVEVSHSGRSSLTTSANLQHSYSTPAIPSPPIAGTFGTNQWYVYGYDGGTLALTGTYKGWYVETGLSYNTNSKWATDVSPSYTIGWNGNCVAVDNHVVVYKRQGFPCAVYQLDVPTHDDDMRIYVNGVQVWSHEPGCCDPHTNTWTGYLNSASTVEVRHMDGAGGSQQALDIVDVTSAVNGGTIAGITNGANVCQGTDPGAFTNTASASGGTIGASGGPAAPVYEWQRATDAGFSSVTVVGTNSTTYDPDNSLTGGTYYFRRKVTDACGTVAYSNTIQINIIHNITATPPTATAATGGTCTQLRANWNAVTGATSYRLDVATDAGFTSMVSGFNDLNVGNVTSYDLNLPLGTYYYRVRAVNSCFTSSNSNVIGPFTLSNPTNNDLYKNAIDISSTILSGNVYNGSFTNDGYGTEGSEPTPNSIYSTAWYKFTTQGTGIGRLDAYITQTGNSDNPALAIYKANAVCPFNLTQLADEWWCSSGDGSDYATCLEPFTTYYLQFGTNDCTLDGGDNGTFNVSVTPVVAAPDNICNAIRIGTTDIGVNQSATTGTYTNSCSTVNTGGYSDPVNDQGNDATDWFYFTTPATQASKYYLHFNNIADFGTWGALEGEIYKKTGGTCPPTLSYVGSWDPDACGVSEESSGFCLDPSSTYYVMVDAEQDGLCGGRGRYQVSVRGENSTKGADLCSQALAGGPFDLGTLNAGATIGNASGSNKWNNYCASASGDPNPGWGTGAPDQPVWFRFTTSATAGRDVTFEAYNDPASLGDQIDLRLALYEGCGGTKIFAEGTQPLYSETVNTTCLKPSTTYFIMVDGWDNLLGGDEGYFGLTVKDNGPYPANDLICGATSLPVQTQYTYNSAYLASENNTKGTYCFEPDPDWTGELGRDNDHGVWYYFGQVPGRTIVVDANDIGSDDINIQMTLYSSTTAKGSCTTPATSPVLTEVEKEFNVTSGHEDAYFNCLNTSLYYWLLVDGADVSGTGAFSALEEGDFSLRAWFPEEGEITGCAAENLGAVPDGGNIYIKNLSNICGASSITNFPAPSSFALDKAVLYKFTTPPAVGYTDASVKIEGFTNPYYDESTYGGPGGGAGGNMDMLENAYNSGDDIDLQLALYSYGACGSSHSVVGSNYDPTVGSGVDVTGASGSDESLIVNCLLPNTEYFLLVDGGALNTNGYYDLKISDYGKHTSNDFLCNAIDISGTYTSPWTNCNSNTVVQLNNQNNYCASTNNDIPTSLGIRPPAWGEMNAPVWYKFKAPKSGKLKIEAINSISDALPPFDEPEISAQLAVFFLPGGYQGTCANLATQKDRLLYIGSNHDALLHDEEYTVDCLMPDSIYYLLVDGSSETLCPGCTRGEFYLKLTADPRDRPATNDALCDAIDLGTPVLSTTIVDTRVSPAGGAASNPSPSTGYPTNTGLHNGARNNANSCMRAENNFCAGTANEPGVSGGTFLTDFSPDATVWYSFTAPTTGEVIIDAYNDPDSRGDQIDLQLAVYESSDGTCSGTMVPIKAEYNVGSFSETMRVQCLNPGQKYWIMVDGSGLNTYGYFELQVQAVTATLSGPANDDICSATAVTYPASIGTTTTVNNQTNRCATIQTIYSEPTTFTKDADVWYKFTTPNTAAPHAVNVTVTSGLPWPFGDAMDPQIALYKMNPTTGPCASSFTLVDDGYSAAGLPFYETFDFHCLEQNTTYYLMVDGSGLNEQGNFKVEFTRINPHPLPTNDNICSVGTTTANGYLGVLGSTTGNKIGNTITNWHNFCSSVEAGESALMTDGNYSLDQTVWFHFKTPNVANNIDVEIRALNDPNNVGDQIDLQMLLVQGNPGCSPTNFTALSPIESDDPALTFNSTIRTCLPPNQDFYVQVDGSGLNKQGYFTLEVENKGTGPAPANDNICNAKTLPSGGTITGSYSGYTNDNNICATLEANEKQQVAGSIQRSVWYKFVAPTSADVSIEVKGNSWVPFTQNYFLPDVTLWELSDNTYTSIDNTIAGCATPSASNWNQLEYNDYQGIPNSLANGVYPTVTLTPLCLKPGYTYYVQVDGTAGIGLDGYFSIQIKNNQSSYSGPGNNEASGATAVPISTASCQYSNGTWQSVGGYSFGTNPTWSNPNLIGITTSAGTPSCNQNCGDVWFKFQMPAACGNNTKSFVKIEGDDEFNLDLDGYPELAIAAYTGGSTTSTANLTYLKCSTGGSGSDPDFSIAANPGDWIYLQVWDMAGNEQGKTFKLCVSEQKSADACADATNMTLDIPYCWSVESHTGEAPSSAVAGSGLNTCFGSGTPQHSSYFKFTTDASTNFCDDYYVYVNTTALAKAMPSGANHACLSGVNSSVSLNYSLWELKSGGTPCTPGAVNVAQEDCITWNDCGGGSFGSNVVGPHGNGGEVRDTIWYNLASGQQLLPNTTYYIVLDYNIDNILYSDRVVLDGIIEVGRRCKGRVWEYTTASVVTTNKYCTTKDGWRHYYDDKGTTATGDDKYVFSFYPNGNTVEGTATINLQPARYSYEDIPHDYAEYVMKRRWDFTINSGSISVSKPVKIRFYYQTAEKQDIIDAAITFKNAYGGYYEDFEWFKSENGHVFNPLTDVNPKVISVGPSGYSETGCLSVWNSSGVYVGPPGVTRCQALTASDWEDNNANQSCNGIHYVEYTGLTGFSGGTGGTGVSPWDYSPLPVELTSFTGYNDGNVNVLDWITASEINTSKFEVEKSTDGYNFSYIGEHQAAGNASSPHTYQLIDNNPFIGNNYYRLKIVNADGTFNYSDKILIKVAKSASEEGILNIYPNPTKGEVNIVYQAATDHNALLTIFNAIGQQMTDNSYQMKAGINTITISADDYAKGLYIINLQNAEAGVKYQSKFVKE